jgi:hypothetical protein
MIFQAAPDSCGRRDAANSGKSDVEGRAVVRGFMTAQSGNVAKFQQSPLPKASPAASGTGEGVHPMGRNSHRRETDGNHRAGGLAPSRQTERQ